MNRENILGFAGIMEKSALNVFVMSPHSNNFYDIAFADFINKPVMVIYSSGINRRIAL
jgi:hypothetical protein